MQAPEPESNQRSTMAWVRGLFEPRVKLWCAIGAGALLLCGWLLGDASPDLAHGAIYASLAIGLFYGGRAAFAAFTSRRVDIDVLMVVGALLAAYIGHPEEGALLLFLFVLSGALERLAEARTRREIQALHSLMPTEAQAFRGGIWVVADPMSLLAGEVVKIRPGDRVPADAIVALGRTEIDQSTMTGESIPRAVGVGDEIYSGTINVDDPIEARVVRPASESSLHRVLRLVMSAREQRQPVQRTIDRLSEPYAIGVLVAAAVVLLVWWLALGRPWTDASYVAITLLIVCSPCALVIATPTATLAAIGRAARFGVLFKGGQAVEALARVGSVCFDKTGTLTIGRPRVQSVQPIAWSDEREMLAIAAALEADSTHPIAAAIREHAQKLALPPANLTGVTHTTGRGMAGHLGTVEVRLGSYKHIESIVPVCLRARSVEILRHVQAKGQIGVVVAKAQAPLESAEEAGQAVVLVLADSVRPGALELVRELHDLGVAPVRMLTGDNRATAEHVAASLGLDRFDAELLPADKLRIVGDMKREANAGRGPRARAHAVGVIGDGVNDAPALAAADVSIAIGSIGSDAALESADIVLLSDDLGTVPWAVRFARRTRRAININLAVATSIIGVMALATLIGSLVGHPVPMSLGVVAHEGGTLLVVVNSLRLLLHPKPQSHTT